MPEQSKEEYKAQVSQECTYHAPKTQEQSKTMNV